MIMVTIRKPAAGVVRTHLECSACGYFTYFDGLERALGDPSASVAAYLEAVFAGTPPDIRIRTRPAAEQADLVAAAEAVPVLRKELREAGCGHV